MQSPFGMLNISGLGLSYLNGVSPFAIQGAYASISFGPYGLTINQHFDWNDSVSNFWWSGPYSGGDWHNKGGSLDISTTWSPYTGNYAQSFDLKQYEGWGNYFNGPEYSAYQSHFQQTEIQQTHNVGWWGGSDNFVFKVDTYDSDGVQIGDNGRSHQHDEHAAVADTTWHGFFQEGRAHDQGYEWHDATQTKGNGFFAEHREDHSDHESDLIVADITPAWMLPHVDPLHTDGWIFGKG